MAKQPRRLEDILGEDFIIDEGEYGPDAPKPKARKGRPSANWRALDPIIYFYIATSKHAASPKQVQFIEMLQKFCEHEGWKVPKAPTIEGRIQYIKRQRFAT
jgi:hypothetical protein